VLILLSLLQAALATLLLNLFLGRLPLPAGARAIRRAALPWLAVLGLSALAISAWQGRLYGLWSLAALLPLNLYGTWLLWKFGLRKQFPNERPLG
jgi:hypothetical protein